MPPVHPGHFLGTASGVPPDAGLHADLVRLEAAYRDQQYAQRSAGPDEILAVAPAGVPRIAVLAQHAICHFETGGARKLADRGTGGIVELLAAHTAVRGIVSSGRLIDVEHQRRRRSTMADLVVETGLPAIDLHGMSCDGFSAVDIGLGVQPSDASLRIADAAVACGERLGLRVTRNGRFPARGRERLTNELLERGVAAVQVELCACLRRPRSGPAQTAWVVTWFDRLIAELTPSR